MKKRLLAVLLSMATVLSSSTVSVFAQSISSDVIIEENEQENNTEVQNNKDFLLGEPVALEIDSSPNIESDDGILNGWAGTGVGTKYRTEEEISAYLSSNPGFTTDAISYKKKPVTSGTLSAGKLSDTTSLSSLNMINKIRYIAGLEPVSLNESYSELAQTGMLADAINKKLSHTPTKPAGMSDEMYAKAYEGCSNSNIMWSSSVGYTLNTAIVNGWLGDSDSSNISRLGHRRWILDPRMKQTGFGSVVGSNGRYSAMYATDGAYRASDADVDHSIGVAWPARMMPLGYFSGSDAWSFSIGKQVEKDGVNVTLKRTKDGKTWNFPDSSKNSSKSNYYFNVDNGGYGLAGCVIFRPDGVNSYNAGDEYNVKITYPGGIDIEYSVTFFGEKNTVSDPVISLFVEETVSANEIASLDSEILISTDTGYSNIYYTLDGSDPVVPAYDGSDTYGAPSAPTRLYDDRILITNDIINTASAVKGKILGTVTVKAIAVRPSFINSKVITKTVTITDDSYDWGDIYLEDRAGFLDATEVKNELWVTGVHDAVYNGKAVTFDEMHVYMHKTLLRLDKDYKVSYKNNKDAGTATVVIKGKGNYKGTYKREFVISPLDISYAKAFDITKTYTGKEIKGKPKVTYMLRGKEVTLAADTDYKITYHGIDPSKVGGGPAFRDNGTYTIIINGIGNYFGSKTITQTVTDKPLITKAKVSAISNVKYTGEEIKPEPAVTYEGKSLTKDVDYKVLYDNNVDAGTAKVLIYGINEYAGIKKVPFTIVGTDINKTSIDCDKSVTYTGKKVLPTISITDLKTGRTLLEGTDYTVVSSNNIKASKTAKVVIKGKGGYSGSYTQYFTVAGVDITSAASIVADTSAVYKKGGAKPQCRVTAIVNGEERVLKSGIDYSLTYSKNDAKGSNATLKIKGKGNFKGTVKQNFLVEGADLALTNMVVSDVVYNKKAGIYKSSVKLTDTDGKKLEAGIDYSKKATYTYARATYVKNTGDDGVERSYYRLAGEKINNADILPIGTEIRVSVSAIDGGNYSGSKSTVYRVVKADITKATVSVKKQTFNGKSVRPSKDAITVKVGGKSLLKSDYDIVSYSKNSAAGTAKVVIKGKGNYGGRKSVSFIVNPRSIAVTTQ